MSWSSIIGQERVKVLLQKTLQTGQIAHAYLFYGPEGIGKDALAIEFAKTLLCQYKRKESCGTCPSCKRFATLQHPNVKIIFPLPAWKNEKAGDDPYEGFTQTQMENIREHLELKARNPYHKIEIDKAKFIKINSVRNVKHNAALSTVEIGKKIFLILNAEYMNAEASNSLLKTLEEPLTGTILLLTTSAKDQLLPTILSRCQLIQCDGIKEADIMKFLIENEGVEQTTARLAAQLANGSFAAAQRFAKQNMAEERDEIADFMRLVLGRNRTLIIDYLEELSSSQEKTGIERWLKLLQSWLRDALLMQHDAKLKILDNEQQDMKKFISKFPGAHLTEALSTVENAIAHLDKNIYLPLVLTNLVLRLRKNIE